MIWLLLLVFAITIAYYFLKVNNEYWKKRGVPGPEPKLIFGNIGESFLMRKSLGEVFADIYKTYEHVPLVGIFRGSSPTLLVRDPQLIKDVLGKDFTSFQENDVDIDMKVDPIFGRNPFVLHGEQWKIVRTQLTPCFSSGKMKAVFPLLEDMGRRLAAFIDEQPEAKNGIGLEAKELCKKFTLNNVASCAFGIEGRCFEDPNSEFQQMARNFLAPSSWNTVKIFLLSLIPVLTKLVSIKFTPKVVEKQIIDLVSQTLKYRQDNNVVRNDFLHMISELRQTSKEYEFTDIDVAAHAAGFFVDGYETSAVTMNFLLYALANNPKAQSVLREEINKKFAENDDKLTYEALQEMSFLDACLNESMRLHPALPTMGKRCTKDYTYVSKPDDGLGQSSINIEKGTVVIIPLLGLQLDPKLFNNPLQFNPERFVGKNEEEYTKSAFLPFGDGPRACLGRRFGSMQVKVGIAYIVKNFELSVNKRTQIPIKYEPMYFLSAAVGGLWINFKKIN